MQMKSEILFSLHSIWTCHCVWFQCKIGLRSKFRLKPLPIYVPTQKNMLSMRKWPYCLKTLFEFPFVKDVILCNRKQIN